VFPPHSVGCLAREEEGRERQNHDANGRYFKDLMSNTHVISLHLLMHAG
jgi:hypothetical protein